MKSLVESDGDVRGSMTGREECQWCRGVLEADMYNILGKDRGVYKKVLAWVQPSEHERIKYNSISTTCLISGIISIIIAASLRHN